MKRQNRFWNRLCEADRAAGKDLSKMEQSAWVVTLFHSGTEGTGGKKAGSTVTRKRQCRIGEVKGS